MKRLLQASGLICFCFLLAGCAGDSREGLISDTIGMMNQAGTEIKNIQKRVDEAVKKVEEGKSSKLDFADAVKAADKLKETGTNTLNLKARIEQVKLQITDDEKKNYAMNKQEELNAAFKDLLAKREDLRKSLAAAEKSSASNAKTAVEDLRKKIVEAEGPFEAISR